MKLNKQQVTEYMNDWKAYILQEIHVFGGNIGNLVYSKPIVIVFIEKLNNCMANLTVTNFHSKIPLSRIETY